MRILFISQYFPPEMGAPAARVHELSRRWVKRGHDVTVLTAFPNHPTGVVPPGYRGRLWMREEIDGIHVVRSFIYSAPNRGVIRRSLSYASFLVSACVLGAPLTKRPDVVLATSPQFLVALAGWFLSRLKRRPLVLEVRDLWPDSIVAVGALREGHPMVRLLRALERRVYRASRKIVVVTASFARELEFRGVPKGDIKVVTNGVDLGRFRPVAERGQLRRSLGLDGKFACLYVGTIGLAHGLETLLAAADLLRASRPEIEFVVVGEGARRRAIEDQARRRGLANVRFLGERPRSEIPGLLAAADLALVLLRRTPLFRTVLPSKMFEAMGAGTPIVLGVEGEALSVLEDAGAGIGIEPENPAALAAAILRLAGDPEERGRLSAAAVRAARERFDRDRLADDYVRWLEAEFTSTGRRPPTGG